MCLFIYFFRLDELNLHVMQDFIQLMRELVLHVQIIINIVNLFASFNCNYFFNEIVIVNF